MRAPHDEVMRRFWRGLGGTLAGMAAFGAVFAMVFWDADFYTARDRWEHFKLAVFGPWSGKPATFSSFARGIDKMDGVNDLVFFNNLTVLGTDLSVTIGVRFATIDDLAESKPKESWCYSTFSDGQAALQIDLAKRDGLNPPHAENFQNLDPELLARFDVTLDTLDDLARHHCRFDRFAIPTSLPDDEEA